MAVKDQRVTHGNGHITIYRDPFKCLASATYDQELFEKISSVTWGIVRSKTGKEYVKSTKYGLLHQLVINHFYGEEVLKEAYKNDYVIDHLDNNGYNCTYENLALIPKKENSAKGLTYDIERQEATENYALNITRDIESKEFQISIAFNKPADLKINGESIPLHILYLRYGIDFKTAFIDARSIINDLNSRSVINFANLRNTGIDYRKAECIYATKEEIEAGMIIRDGKVAFIQGSPNFMCVKAAHNANLHNDKNDEVTGNETR